jgi:hypothetical protein
VGNVAKARPVVWSAGSPCHRASRFSIQLLLQLAGLAWLRKVLVADRFFQCLFPGRHPCRTGTRTIKNGSFIRSAGRKARF